MMIRVVREGFDLFHRSNQFIILQSYKSLNIWSAAKLVYNDHTSDPKIVAVVDNGACYRGTFIL